MNKTKSIVILAVLVCLSLGLSNCDSCKSKPKETKMTTITIGIHSWPGGGIAYIADKMGYFKENGINLGDRPLPDR